MTLFSPVIAAKLKRLNARIPAALEREDKAITKTLRKPRISPLDGLGTLYAFVDRYLDHTTGLTACKRGCAACCHSEVAVSRLEADYIAHKTQILTAPHAGATAMKSERYVDLVKPCPFLDSEKACSIYPYRPMMCRTHLSLEMDSIPCEDELDRGIVLLDRARSMPGAMRAYIELVRRHGEAWADVRDYFGTATKNASVIRL